MRKSILPLAIICIVGCTGNSNNAKDNNIDTTQTEEVAYVDSMPTESDIAAKSDIAAEQASTDIQQSNSSAPSSDTEFRAGSYEQGMYDGLNDGAEDAVEGRAFNYKYKSSSPEYIKGYKEGYSNAYNEGVKVVEEAEKEYEKLQSEYGLDDLDGYDGYWGAILLST